MSKVFVLTYDAEAARAIQKQFVAFLKSARDVIDWHSPYEGVVFLSSNEHHEKLGMLFSEFFDGEIPYLVSVITTGHNYGMMAQSTWEWLKKNFIITSDFEGE